MEPAHEISWRPLGELFVEKGLLTEERLEQALAEQAATGGRLGDKLVELGYVTRHALAQLLAEQTGVEFDLDSGFGTGLLAELRRRKDGTDSVEGLPQPVAVDDMWEPTIIHSAPPARPTEKAERMSTFNALEDMWARLTAAEARIEELQRELRTIPRS